MPNEKRKVVEYINGTPASGDIQYYMDGVWQWSIWNTGQGDSNFYLDWLSDRNKNPTLGDNFFGNYTDSNGVTFTWKRPSNWDSVADQYLRENGKL
jgi:hypothetical protein